MKDDATRERGLVDRAAAVGAMSLDFEVRFNLKVAVLSRHVGYRLESIP